MLVSRLYYSNWVLGSYNDGTYALLNTIGQAPLGFGIFLVWPLIKKFGKRNCILYGSVLSVIGMTITLIAPRNLTMVLAGLVVFSCGSLFGTYTNTAVMADTMDYVEYTHGFRCDGLTVSIYSIVQTICTGFGTGLLNLGLALFNYVPPAADGSVAVQSAGLQNFLIFMALGTVLISSVSNILCMLPYRLDKEMPALREACGKKDT